VRVRAVAVVALVAVVAVVTEVRRQHGDTSVADAGGRRTDRHELLNARGRRGELIRDRNDLVGIRALVSGIPGVEELDASNVPAGALYPRKLTAWPLVDTLIASSDLDEKLVVISLVGTCTVGSGRGISSRR
jgi:hypothetical protein